MGWVSGRYEVDMRWISGGYEVGVGFFGSVFWVGFWGRKNMSFFTE